MAGKKQIKTALISVFHKDGLEDLLKKRLKRLHLTLLFLVVA